MRRGASSVPFQPVCVFTTAISFLHVSFQERASTDAAAAGDATTLRLRCLPCPPALAGRQGRRVLPHLVELLVAPLAAPAQSPCAPSRSEKVEEVVRIGSTHPPPSYRPQRTWCWASYGPTQCAAPASGVGTSRHTVVTTRSVCATNKTATTDHTVAPDRAREATTQARSTATTCTRPVEALLVPA